MKKITIIANSDMGLYKFRKELIVKLLEDYKITLVLPKGDFISDFTDMGCQINEVKFDRRGTNIFKDLITFASLFLTLLKEKPDLVLTYTIKPNIYGGLACKLLNIKYIMNITGLGSSFYKKSFGNKIIRLLYLKSLKKVSKVFFENENDLASFNKKFNLGIHKCVIQKGAGVNLQEFSYYSYPKQSDKTNFTFIGRIMKEKGIDELLYVANRLHDENINAEIHIIGQLEEDYGDALNKYTRDKIVYYHGYQSDIHEYIKKMNCLVLASYHEGMANTVLESSAVGRPVIGSNIPGIKEAIVDGVSGFLVEPKNSSDLFTKMISFIELDYDEKEQMGLLSRKKMEEEFDKRDVVQKTINIINSVII